MRFGDFWCQKQKNETIYTSSQTDKTNRKFWFDPDHSKWYGLNCQNYFSQYLKHDK